MATPRPHDRTPQLWRWSLAIVLAAGLLGAWWLALDRVATRVGQDVETTMRELPRQGDASRRSD